MAVILKALLFVGYFEMREDKGMGKGDKQCNKATKVGIEEALVLTRQTLLIGCEVDSMWMALGVDFS